MASKEPASFVDRTTWDFLNLLDMLGSRNGRVGVMEVDHADSRAPSLLVDFTRDLCGTGDIKHKPQQAENEGKEEEDLVPPHLIFMLWQASVLKRLMQWDHLEEAVRDVRNLLPCLPDVLVLVMIRPDSQEQLDQAVRALRRMQCVLDGALQLTVETAIYSPGQPGGVLEAKRAACRALREALNCHEEVDSQEPFVISLPELRYCRVLPERREEKNTSVLVTCLSAQAFCMDEIQCVAAARRGHCTLSITLSLPQNSELFAALAEQSAPGNFYQKSLSFCFALNALLDYQNVPKKPVPKKTAVSREEIRACQRPLDFKLSQN